MPSPRSIWLISSPLSPSADAGEMLSDIQAKLDPSQQDINFGQGSVINNGKAAAKKLTGKELGSANRVEWGDFKTGTLSSLLTLADTVTKYDAVFQGTVDKIVDTIRSLTSSSDSGPSSSGPSSSRTTDITKHLLTEDGQPYLSTLTNAPGFYYPDESLAAQTAAAETDETHGWTWNRAKYRVEGRALSDVVEALYKDLQSLDTIHKQKLQSYNAAKGQLAILQRKRIGNLATRDLSTIVRKEELPDLHDSEYLEVLFVVVSKNNVKDFEAKYERLSSMVVPRSANKIAQDDEYALYTVTVFRRIRDEFIQKCREEKFNVREFKYDEAVIEKQKRELDELEASEKDLWTDLLRVSRINFAESYSLLIHLKVVASYVECVLRYGLPAEYFICAISPNPKEGKKLLSTLSSYFSPFTPNIDHSNARLVGSNRDKKNKKKAKVDSSGFVDENALVGEFQNLMDEEVFDFVLQELPIYSMSGGDNQ